MKYIVVVNYSLTISPLVRLYDDKEKAIAFAKEQEEKGLKYSIHLMHSTSIFPMEIKSNY